MDWSNQQRYFRSRFGKLESDSPRHAEVVETVLRLQRSTGSLKSTKKMKQIVLKLKNVNDT